MTIFGDFLKRIRIKSIKLGPVTWDIEQTDGSKIKELKQLEVPMYSNIKKATVAVAVLHPNNPKKPFTVIGTGFCIDSKGIVVTCEHVISEFMSKPVHQQVEEITPEEKKKKIQKTSPISFTIPFVIFYRTKLLGSKLIVYPCKTDLLMARTNYDLCLLRLCPHKAFPDGFPYLEVEDYSLLKEGDEVGTCGFPLGNFLYDQLGTATSSFTKGIISSIIPVQGTDVNYLRGFQLALTATHGSSGGPVYSLKTGKVFGVLQKGVYNSDGKLLPGLVKAEPVYHILGDDVDKIKNAPPGKLPPNISEFIKEEDS